jgi:lysozyme
MTTPRAALPHACLDLVKHFEGLYLNAYLCPAGVPTIGYGHTAGVTMGQTITASQAERFLEQDLAAAARDVDRLVKVPLASDRRGALASFTFNLGAGKLESSTLLKLLNKGDVDGAAEQFGAWVKATVDGKKKTLPGLVARRAAEAALFRGEDWRAAAAPQRMPQAVEVASAMKPLRESRSIKAAKIGVGASAVLTALEQAQPVLEQVQAASDTLRQAADLVRPAVALLPHPAWIVAIILAVTVVYLVWRRIDDHRRQET